MRKIYFFIFLLTVLAFIPFANRGLTLHDEGYILHAANVVAQGGVLYRDAFILYTPGLPLVLGLLFKLFNSHILIGRSLSLVLGGLINISLFSLTRKLLSSHKRSPQSTIYDLIPSMLFACWGIPHINFPWPSWFSLLFFLIFLNQLITPPLNKRLFLLGVTSSLVFSFKQNLAFAPFSALALISIYLVNTKAAKKLAKLATGLLVPLIPSIFYLIHHQALSEALNTIFSFAFRYAREGLMYLPYPKFLIDPTNLLHTAAKTFLYHSPLLALALSTIIASAKKHQLITLYSILASLYFLSGVYPTADILHLSLVLPVSFIPLAYLASQTKLGQLEQLEIRSILPRAIISVWILLLALVGLHKLQYRNYYAFESPYPLQTIPVNIRGDTILTDPKHAQIINQLVPLVQQQTQANEPIFVHSYAPLIYFAADRPAATRFTITQPGFITPTEQQELIQTLEDNKVHLIVSQDSETSPCLKDTKLLCSYLRQNYSPIATVSGLQVKTFKE